MLYSDKNKPSKSRLRVQYGFIKEHNIFMIMNNITNLCIQFVQYRLKKTCTF